MVQLEEQHGLEGSLLGVCEIRFRFHTGFNWKRDRTTQRHMGSLQHHRVLLIITRQQGNIFINLFIIEGSFQFEFPLCDISAHLTSTFLEDNHAKRTLTSKN